MDATEGLCDILEERTVVDAPLSVVVAVVGIFDATEVTSKTGTT